MALKLLVDTAAANPSEIKSGASITVSVMAMADADSTHALARYVIDDDAPFVFGGSVKATQSDLVLVGPAGTPVSCQLQISATSGERGLLPVHIFVSERSAGGAVLGVEWHASVIVDVR